MKKTVLITGASKGIGKALADKMLVEGYEVIGTSRSGQIDIDHKNFRALKLDVSSASSLDDAHKQLFSQYNHIDMLINNAGVGPDLGESIPDIESYDHTFDVNVKGLVFFTEPLIKIITDNGKIINVSSKLGSVANCDTPSSIAYRMSKSALNMYTKVLSNRLNNSIKVASIHPGWVQTTIQKSNLINAPLTPKESAKRIYRFITSEFRSGIYWDCEDDVELSW